MTEENKSIHDFDFDLICDYFSALERQGPGSKEATLKALNFIEKLNENSQIVDIGCGTGGQTLVLGQNTLGNITGIDLSPLFIDRLNDRARQLNLHKKVKGIVASMENMPIEEESLDLIWSEGAIYNIGFERGLNEWKKYLKKDGYIAVTDAVWFTPSRPKEIEKFWQEAYPEIDTVSKKIAQMEKAGYVPKASFILPETCWLENFYYPQAIIQKEFLEKHAGNKAAEDFVKGERHEAALYNKYKTYYGYAFFIGKKPNID